MRNNVQICPVYVKWEMWNTQWRLVPYVEQQRGISPPPHTHTQKGIIRKHKNLKIHNTWTSDTDQTCQQNSVSHFILDRYWYWFILHVTALAVNTNLEFKHRNRSLFRKRYGFKLPTKYSTYKKRLFLRKLLTPWCRVLLKNLTVVTQLVKKYPAFLWYHKRRAMSWIAEWLLASQKRLCPM
jgi:hypothetical protein